MVQNLELPVLIGFCYPCLPLLTALAIGLNAGVLHIAVRHLGLTLSPEGVLVPTSYLWGSLGIGCGIVMWLFNEADLGGRRVVNIGMPMILIVAVWWMSKAKPQTQQLETLFALQDLRKSLLEHEDPSEGEPHEDMANGHLPAEL